MYNRRIGTQTFFFAFALLAFVTLSFAQQVVRLDPYEQKYEPGVVLVKFEEKVDMPLGKKGRLGKVALTGIREALAKYGIEQGERLFPQAKRGERLGKVRGFSGEEIEVKSLYNIFKLEFDPKHDAKTVAEELAKQEGVVYAEPDYIFSALETVPNDPLYSSQQWYLPVVNAPAAWDTTTGDTTQIIAIIDTGIDWDHPDLDGKIKINWTEYNGATGVDDDGNGYVDDIRGWDFINSDNNPNDDNSHGTHVAGIAAAETNNGTGIAGVCWGAKILPVKVLQSTGYGSSSTIAQGVTYGAARGATILNLSLGSYSESLTLKTALENAYSTAMIVAAAGNDGIKIEGLFGAPMFPACYDWVIGVEATKQTWDEKYGWRATFSNYDPSGPVSYNNDYGYNYELKAPGVSIHSTLPNGQYGNLSGTSMATPIVSGAAALLKSQQPSISTELLLGNLINGLGNTLDIVDAMQQSPQPDLRYISYTLVDTLAGCDQDGRPDAGETVQIWLTVQNVWEQADSVWSKLRLGPLEDPTVATVTDSTSFIINGLSAYATATGESDPFQVQLASGLVNNRQIVFNYEIGCKNGGTQATGDLILTVQKGIELSGVISGHCILKADNYYIVPSNLVIDSLTIRPGTHLYLSEDVSIIIIKYIKAVGTRDSMIVFSRNGDSYWKYVKMSSQAASPCDFKYCIFEYAKGHHQSGTSIVDKDNNNTDFSFEDCLFRWNKAHIFFAVVKTTFTQNCFYDNSNASYLLCGYYGPLFQYNNVINNSSLVSSYGVMEIDRSALSLVKDNILFNNSLASVSIGPGLVPFDIYHLSPNYFGTTDSSMIAAEILDYFDNSSKPVIMGDSALVIPPKYAHAIVWKVLINGQNPQEETLDPVGMETVRFDVYFNRAMDIAYEPAVTFGVRDPYTQHVVEDTTAWSADSTIWHGYYTAGLETGDGINTIRVSGAKDTDHFEIPIENRRFHFTIDAAGSAANQFIATVGVGKVDLEWPTAPTEDVLGYNMYRSYNLTDSTYSDTTRINISLITDTTYTDFDVIPDTTYHYMYKVLGTDMAESDYSKSVAATPVNASSGDANGDMTVNVLDIVAIVNYILEENPQPFLLEAADVNDDGSVNVLDIVGVVNIILGTPKQVATELAYNPASLTVSREGIVLNSPVPVYALQFTLTGNDLAQCILQPTEVLNGFEIGKNETEERIKVVIYTLTGRTIPEGEHKLFSIEGSADLSLKDVILVDRSGNLIPTGVGGIVQVPKEYALYQNYPNPFNPTTRIRYAIPEASHVKVSIFNILGQRVQVFNEGQKSAGYYEILWDGTSNDRKVVGSGIYFCRFEAGNYMNVKKMMIVR